jgi:hypothetical protein
VTGKDETLSRCPEAATELHCACSGPIIAPSCDHFRALTELNAAIVTASEAVTGDKAPWMQTPKFDQHPDYKPPAIEPPM